ncbi:MAG TPA: DUF4255 domain-containing protein [Lunatimonas sp.]|nr:DUF4255 domain-containing protein [Lunatimonas sp.]
MIDQVLISVVNLLNEHIGTIEPDVVLGNLSMLDTYQEGVGDSFADRVVVSIINIQQESTLRNTPANRQIFNNAGLPNGVARNPGIYLNVYLIIGANKDQYAIGLQRISQVLTFFQRHSIFTIADIPNLSEFNLDRIIFDLYSTSFEELNQLWGIMGGKYIPSVVYKMRMLYIDNVEEGAEINLVKIVDTRYNKLDA